MSRCARHSEPQYDKHHKPCVSGATRHIHPLLVSHSETLAARNMTRREPSPCRLQCSMRSSPPLSSCALKRSEGDRHHVAQCRKTRALQKRPKNRANRANALAPSEKGICQIQPGPAQSAAISPSDGMRRIDKFSFKREQRLHGKPLCTQRIRPCRAVRMNQIDAHRLADHANTPTSST